MENELYHHGVLGQKWGVRRYQNKDGSLTMAGKKRALRIQNDYTELTNNKKYRDRNGNMTYAGRKKALALQSEYTNVTGKKHLIAFNNKTSKQTRQKSISEMSNQELQAKVDRLRLEKQLKDLTPEHKTAGQKFVGFVKDTSMSIIKDKGTRILGDYVDKQVRDAIGLNKKDPLTKSQKLAQDAKDAANKKVIAQVEDYFKERDKGKNPATDTKKNSGYTMTEAQKKEHDALFGNHETKTESDAEKRKREHDKLFSGRY